MEKIDQFFATVYERIRQIAFISDHAAAVSRVLLGVFILCFTLPFGSSYAFMPDGLFQPSPYSFTALLDGFPHTAFFLTFELLSIFTALALVLGIRSRWAALIFGLSFIIVKSFAFSLGKIDHSIFLPITAFCLGVTNAGSYYALLPDRKWKHTGIGPALLAIFLCYGMFTAGLPKLVKWVDFDTNTSGFLSWFNASFFNQTKDIPLADLVFMMPPWMTELMDYTATFFELLAFACLLWSRKAWRAWITIACVFHVMNVLFLAIDFRLHIIVYLPFLLTPLVKRWPPGLTFRWITGVLGIGLAAYRLFRRLTLELGPEVELVNPFAAPVVPLSISLGFWMIIISLGIWSVWKTEEFTT